MFGLGLIWLYLILALFLVSVVYELYRSRDIVDEDVLELIPDKVFLQVIVPWEENSTLLGVQLLSSLHSILANQHRSKVFFSFEIGCSKDSITYYVVCDNSNKEFIKSQIYAQYPFSHIEEVADYIPSFSSIQLNSSNTPKVSISEIELQKDFILPIKTFESIQNDTLLPILSTLNELEVEQFGILQVIARPINHDWQRIGKDYVRKVRIGINPFRTTSCLTMFLNVLSYIGSGLLLIFDFLFFPNRLQKVEKSSVVLSDTQLQEIGNVEQKSLEPGFEIVIRTAVITSSNDLSEKILGNVDSAFKHFNMPHLNGFRVKEYRGRKAKKNLSIIKSQEWEDLKDRFLSNQPLDILNTKELASIYHFPSGSMNLSKVARIGYKKLAPPANLPINEPMTIAKTDYRGQLEKFGIKQVDRRRHMYILGKSGTGKSTLIKNMIVQDIMNGQGVGLLDPHGDLATEILSFIPEKRLNDVVIIDPSDIENPVALNILELNDLNNLNVIADGIVAIFKKYFDSWGPRLEYILHNTLLTLLSVKGNTLLGVQRILTDSDFRANILSQIDDPIILQFWNNEYIPLTKNPRLAAEVISPIQNKVGKFLSSSTIRNIIGQVESTIDFEEIINTKKILIVNLSVGKLGEETASTFGGLIIEKLQEAAMRRVMINEDERNDFYLYIDEFQRFAFDNFVQILSESRKFKLNLILANQYVDQLSPQIQSAIFANIATTITFAIGSRDAENLEKDFKNLSVNDFTSLDKYHFYINELIDGEPGNQFSAVSMPFEYNPESNLDEVINSSRLKYSRPKYVIEEKIKNWMQQAYSVNKLTNTYYGKDRVSLQPRKIFSINVSKNPNVENVQQPKLYQKDNDDSIIEKANQFDNIWKK